MCVYNEQKLYHTYAPLPGTAIVSRLGPLAAMPNCYLAPLVEKPGYAVFLGKSAGNQQISW